MKNAPHPDVIVNVLPKQKTTPIIWVEVHVKSINLAIAAIVDDDCHTNCTVRFPCTVWFDASQPSGIRRYINCRSEVDFGPVVRIQIIKIVERQRCWIAIYNSIIDLRVGLNDLGCNVARKVCLARVEPYNWCCEVLSSEKASNIMIDT